MSGTSTNPGRPARGGMGHGPGHGMMGEKAKDFRGSIGKMLGVIGAF